MRVRVRVRVRVGPVDAALSVPDAHAAVSALALLPTYSHEGRYLSVPDAHIAVSALAEDAVGREGLHREDGGGMRWDSGERPPSANAPEPQLAIATCRVEQRQP